MSMQRGWSFWAVATLLAVLVVIAPQARADSIQSDASLPPETGAYTAPTLCVQVGPGVCVVNPALFGFTGTTSMINGMGQAIDSNISFKASIYTDNGGLPGTFLGNLSMGGPIGIFYSGRTSDSQLGTFTSTLTELNLTGTFNGHTIAVMLGIPPSSGPTTISQDGSQFLVSSFFDVFAEVSIDGGPFMQGPERTFTLTPIPEPSTVSVMALGLAGVAASGLRRRVGGLLRR